MTPDILKKRTFEFALRTLRSVDLLPQTAANQILGKQVMRSATSIGANYRAVCKAKSGPDFINKLKMVEEESDETTYWLDLIKEYNKLNDSELNSLISESKELEAIFSKSVVTAKQNMNWKPSTGKVSAVKS